MLALLWPLVREAAPDTTSATRSKERCQIRTKEGSTKEGSTKEDSTKEDSTKEGSTSRAASRRRPH
jgi:hypothetical protein